jgi:hypothetical protein
MRAPVRPAAHGRLAIAGCLALAVAALVGCASSTRVAVPAELPHTAREQGFEFRWALERDPGTIRAVGLARSLAHLEAQFTLALFGLDGAGRIASRGTTVVRFGFARDPAPFVVALHPTGREASFELRIVEVVLNNFRTN